MKHVAFLVIVFLLVSGSCAPSISTRISSKYPVIDYRKEIKVYEMDELTPFNTEVLGLVKIGDNGLSTNCGYDVVIELAKTEARKVGGNAIKITKHILPDFWGSTCHRLTVQILRCK